MEKILVALFSVVSLCVSAQDGAVTISQSTAPEAKEYRKQIKEALNGKGQVKGIQELPITKLYFVEAENGNYIVSADGRFIFQGSLKDVWHRRTINSLEAARKAERVPLSNIGFEPEQQLATFTIGNAKKRTGAIFVDPTSPVTMTALKELTTRKNERWTVILMPLVGGDSAMHRARSLWCAENVAAAKTDLINGTDKSFSKMKPGCSEEPIVMAMMLTDIFGVTHLPLVVREDGLRSEGFPEQFNSWMKQQ